MGKGQKPKKKKKGAFPSTGSGKMTSLLFIQESSLQRANLGSAAGSGLPHGKPAARKRKKWKNKKKGAFPSTGSGKKMTSLLFIQESILQSTNLGSAAGSGRPHGKPGDPRGNPPPDYVNAVRRGEMAAHGGWGSAQNKALEKAKKDVERAKKFNNKKRAEQDAIIASGSGVGKGSAYRCKPPKCHPVKKGKRGRGVGDVDLVELLQTGTM